MSDALAKLRAAQAALKSQNDRTSNGPSELYRHWNIDFDKSCTLRFLPDGDPNNLFFWKKKMLYEWKFPTADGSEVRLVMPCIKTFDTSATDDVYNLLGEMFSMTKKSGDQSHAEAAKPYWVKTSFMMQGFVRASDYKEDEVPESLIRKFDFSKDLFQDTIGKRVEDSNEETALRNWPVDIDAGLNYIVKKTRGSNGYASYAGSQFSNNPTALTEVERASISGGIPSLERYLPSQLSPEGYALQMTMLETALGGGVWNREWEDAGFKPYAARDQGENAPATPATPKPVLQTVSATATTAPVETETAGASASPASNDMAQRAERIKAAIAANKGAS